MKTLTLLVFLASGAAAQDKPYRPGPETPCDDCRVFAPRAARAEDLDAAWARAGWTAPETYVIELAPREPFPADAAPRHRVEIAVVVLRETGWTMKTVARRLARVASVYSQPACRIALDRATLVIAGAPEDQRSVLYDVDDRRAPGSLSWYASRLPAGTARPVLFYIGDFSDRAGQPGTSRPRNDNASDARDTAWITTLAVDDDQPFHLYSTDAHELGHVIADSGHDGAPHTFLIGNPGARTDRADPAICEKMRRHPAVKPL